MYNFIVKEIKIDMFIGICDFEYKNKQSVIVNVKASGETPIIPKNIVECFDYSKVCAFVKSWENREHVELVETLLFEVILFCFDQDDRIMEVEVEILKPAVIPYTTYVGVSRKITREIFQLFQKNKGQK